jgi:hypothetical protein
MAICVCVARCDLRAVCIPCHRTGVAVWIRSVDSIVRVVWFVGPAPTHLMVMRDLVDVIPLAQTLDRLAVIHTSALIVSICPRLCVGVLGHMHLLFAADLFVWCCSCHVLMADSFECVVWVRGRRGFVPR